MSGKVAISFLHPSTAHRHLINNSVVRPQPLPLPQHPPPPLHPFPHPPSPPPPIPNPRSSPSFGLPACSLAHYDVARVATSPGGGVISQWLPAYPMSSAYRGLRNLTHPARPLHNCIFLFKAVQSGGAEEFLCGSLWLCNLARIGGFHHP